MTERWQRGAKEGEARKCGVLPVATVCVASRSVVSRCPHPPCIVEASVAYTTVVLHTPCSTVQYTISHISYLCLELVCPPNRIVGGHGGGGDEAEAQPSGVVSLALEDDDPEGEADGVYDQPQKG